MEKRQTLELGIVQNCPDPCALRPSCINKIDLDNVVEPTMNMNSIPLLYTNWCSSLPNPWAHFCTQVLSMFTTQYNPLWLPSWCGLWWISKPYTVYICDPSSHGAKDTNNWFQKNMMDRQGRGLSEQVQIEHRLPPALRFEADSSLDLAAEAEDALDVAGETALALRLHLIVQRWEGHVVEGQVEEQRLARDWLEVRRKRD